MNSRTWLNLALLILVAAAALIATYLPGVKKPAAPVTLTALPPEQITHIAIRRSGQADIDLVKDKTGWRMTAPLKLPASDFHVQTLMHLTQATSHSRFPAQGQNLAKYKLAEPRVRLRLNDVEMAFGDTEGINQRRYVLLNGVIHLIDDSVYYNLIAEPTTWVSMALLPAGSHPTEIDLPGLKLARTNDRWSLTPPPVNASADAINTLVDGWTQGQALQVKPYQKQTALGSVLIRLQDIPDPIRFDITARTPELILARPELGVQYHLPAERAEHLLKLP